MSKIKEAVERIALPILEENGLELVDISFKKEGQTRFLRVFVDRIGGRVGIDDCTQVSEQLSKELDRTDPIKGSYMLEVSSAGAERPLKTERDFRIAIGKRVFISTYEPVDGRKTFEGTLVEYSPEKLAVETEGEKVEIPVAKVAQARLAIVF